MHTIRSLSRLLIIFAVVFTIVGFSSASNATITVTTFLDEYDYPGSGSGCSLREAITAANTDTAFGGCPAGSGIDTIKLSAGNYTFTRAGSDDTNINGDLDINSSLNLTGAGMNRTTIDANGISRVMSINDDHTVSITDLALNNGSAILGDAGNGLGSGLINNLGTVTLTRVVVYGNHAQNGYGCGGVANNGNMLISGSWLMLNFAGTTYDNPTESGTVGGGICNLPSASLTIDYTIIEDNYAGDRSNATASSASVVGGHGGGIYNEGTLTIDHSLIRDNHAGDISASLATVPYGVYGGYGGGIYNTGILTITNTTLAYNIPGDATAPVEIPSYGGSGGALANLGGTVLLDYDTLYGNRNGSGGWQAGETGGFVQAGGSHTIHNSIFFGNSLRNGYCFSGSVFSQDYNIWSSINCTISGSTTHSFSLNPLMIELTGNGGPTDTLALQSGSPAIDAGDPAYCLGTDQRGFYRPVDGDKNGSPSCDIGAYEYGHISSFIPLILRFP
jgi:CSLREA domain-containing protein